MKIRVELENGRIYLLIDTGKPLTRRGEHNSIVEGGFLVNSLLRYSPETWGYIGNFETIEDFRWFIRCMRRLGPGEMMESSQMA